MENFVRNKLLTPVKRQSIPSTAAHRRQLSKHSCSKSNNEKQFSAQKDLSADRKKQSEGANFMDAESQNQNKLITSPIASGV
jgi:hypothetical protein